MAMTVAEIKNAFATINEEGVQTAFDFDAFDKVVTDLISERASMRADAKAKATEAKKAANAEIGWNLLSERIKGDCRREISVSTYYACCAICNLCN